MANWSGEGGGICSIHDQGIRWSFTLQTYPKKYTSLKFYTQKKYLASKFLTYKNTRLSTSILICPIKQTLRPKIIRVNNFQPPKNTSNLPVMYTASTPLG